MCFLCHISRETAIAVDKTKKEAMATKTELESATLQMKETISESIIDLPKDTTLEEDLLSFSEEDSFSFEPLTYETVDKTEVKNKPKASEKASSKTENTGKKEEAVKPQAKKKTKVVYPSDKKNTSNNAVPELSGITDDGSNNNEKILEMHRQGKSNVAIAKALGLGVGEVNLVIDLFEVM